MALVTVKPRGKGQDQGTQQASRTLSLSVWFSLSVSIFVYTSVNLIFLHAPSMFHQRCPSPTVGLPVYQCQGNESVFFPTVSSKVPGVSLIRP